jgi:hypothetical protein
MPANADLEFRGAKAKFSNQFRYVYPVEYRAAQSSFYRDGGVVDVGAATPISFALRVPIAFQR